MAQRKNVNDRIRWSHGTEQISNESITDSLTPEVQFMGGIYRTSNPTYTNGQNAMASFTSDGKLRTDAAISGDVNVDSTSVNMSGYVGKASGTNADFTTAYTAGTTITFSNLPTEISAFTADDIVSVVQVATDGSVTATYTRDDSIMTMAGDVLTVASATFAASDTFIVYTNVKRAEDIDTPSSGNYSNAMGDFTATANNGAKTITIAGLPFTLTANHVIGGGSIKVTDTNDNVSNVPLTDVAVSGGVITLADKSANFATTDIVVVQLQGPDKAYSLSTDSNIVSRDDPEWSRYTSKEAIIATAQGLDATPTDMGAEIDMRGYNQLGVWLTVNIGTSTDATLRVLHKHSSAGAEEYREIYLGSPAANITSINLNDYQVAADSDQLIKINIPVSATSPFIQLQVSDAADGDGTIDAAYITKAWAA